MSSVTAPRDLPATRPGSGSVQQQDKAAPKPASTESSVHYTCFIRLPFPRADFIDPPQVEWNSAKDRSLWKIISKASSSKELDWEDLSARFDVSLSFLLQQAAWLYERHFAQMKAQMKKLSPSTNPSPVPPDSASNVSTPITGAFPFSSLGSRAPSALSTRARDSPTPIAASGNSGTIKPPGVGSSVIAGDSTFATYASAIPSRTPSTRTVTQSRTAETLGPAPPSNRSFRSSFAGQRRAPPQTQLEETEGYESPPPAEPSESESSSDDDDDERASQSMARSQAFRRPPHLGGGARKAGLAPYAEDPEDDEDDEFSGGFLPFATVSSAKKEDPSATLRSPPPKKKTERGSLALGPVESSTSSGSSITAPAPRQQHQGTYTDPASALSPRRRAELSGRSPHLRREGSEGAPSMGSSFSDLDDASISQSALEDAYLSNMQRGTASRMSTISQALKSRYL